MKNISFRNRMILILLGLSLPLLWLSFALAESYFLRETARQNQQTLRLVISGLKGALLRYQPIPALLAEKQNIVSLLSNDLRRVPVKTINEELKRISNDVGASDIYVIDAEGNTIAANNYDKKLSFIGKNFAYRPYFTQAMKGESASFFALGTTSLKRGYYFSAPIKLDGRILGVVTLKITLEGIEQNWKGNTTEIIATDRHGVIFMSSREDWLFKSFAPLSHEAISEITNSKQYPIDKLGTLNAIVESSVISQADLVNVPAPPDKQQSGNAYFAVSNLMEEAGWRLHVLSPRADASAQAYTVLALSTLAVLFIASIAAMIFWRRAQLVKNMQLQRIAQEQLEHRVQERTNDLNEANKKLKLEVHERTQAETQLRKTQNELVQAGKLAALGQMSAALSHELNQPLAAVKSYADNAKAFLKRNNLERAEENIGHIAQMADRMAELGTHLRNFARKPKQAIDIVDLDTVITAVNQIMSARLKETGASLQIKKPSEQLLVKGGLVRLQQVLVNLVNNALDAMQDSSDAVIDIHISADDEHVEVEVRDYGQGIRQDDINAIFDPFFTTKGVNEGLGLGLSISYNIVQDFGGSLSARNHADGGAEFTLQLQRAQAAQRAAE